MYPLYLPGSNPNDMLIPIELYKEIIAKKALTLDEQKKLYDMIFSALKKKCDELSELEKV